MSSAKVFLLVLLAGFELCACADSDFRSAKKMEKLGRYPSAVQSYEFYVQNHPKSPKSAEALYRIAEIYKHIFKDYAKAKFYYRQLIGHYLKSEWFSPAQEALAYCPDYFYIAPENHYTLGDSESGGRYMKTEMDLYSMNPKGKKVKLRKTIYAGKTLVSKTETTYEQKDRELREISSKGNSQTIILKYPAVKGLKWESSRKGKKYIYSIEGTDLVVQTKAGDFFHCVKVKEQPKETPWTWRLEYYAPETGPILTSAATNKSETRIIELISSGMREPDRPGKDESESAVSLFQQLKSWVQEKVQSPFKKS